MFFFWLVLTEVEENIADVLRWTVFSKEVSIKNKIQFSVYMCFLGSLSPYIVHKWGFKGVFNFNMF